MLSHQRADCSLLIPTDAAGIILTTKSLPVFPARPQWPYMRLTTSMCVLRYFAGRAPWLCTRHLTFRVGVGIIASCVSLLPDRPRIRPVDDSPHLLLRSVVATQSGVELNLLLALSFLPYT